MCTEYVVGAHQEAGCCGKRQERKLKMFWWVFRVEGSGSYVTCSWALVRPSRSCCLPEMFPLPSRNIKMEVTTVVVRVCMSHPRVLPLLDRFEWSSIPCTNRAVSLSLGSSNNKSSRRNHKRGLLLFCLALLASLTCSWW